MQGWLRMQPNFMRDMHLQPHMGCSTSGAVRDACALQPRLNSQDALRRPLIKVTQALAYIDPSHDLTSASRSAHPCCTGKQAARPL